MAADNDGVWGATVGTRVTIRKSVAIESECSYSFSLGSFESEGPSWAKSGDQQFIAHDTITLTADNRSGVLEIEGPKCYGQVDLYQGTTIYDGGSQAGHTYIPRYPDLKIDGLVAGWGGGRKCTPVTAAAQLDEKPCVAGAGTAAVTLSVTKGTGSMAFTVWARTGDAAYVQVGAKTLPAGDTRDATVTVPLVEDSPVTVEVRVGNSVLRTFDPVTADCVAQPPVVPSAEQVVGLCVDGVATATMTLAVSEGAGSSTFTVWARTGNGAYAQVGPATTLPSADSRHATGTAPLVEDAPVTIQVRVGGVVLETFAAVTADCLDGVAPVATASTDPASPNGGQGWFTTAVSVIVTATDEPGGSGVAEIVYSVDGGPVQTAPGANATVPLTGQGVLSFTYFARDNAGNAGAPRTFTVALDRTAPVNLAATFSRPPDGGGYYRAPVKVSFSATDLVSGLAGCTSATYGGADSDTAGVAGSCTDKAGNVASTVAALKYDATAPTVTYAGNAGSYTVDEDIAITCVATDNLSGIASTTCQDITVPAWSLPLGTNTFSATATDRAGNTTTSTIKFKVEVTHRGVGNLSERFSAEQQIVKGLRKQLDAAAEEDKAKTANNRLKAYSNKVRAEKGKAFTPSEADTLVHFATALELPE